MTAIIKGTGEKISMSRQALLLFGVLVPFIPILLISALLSLPILFIGFPLIFLNVSLYIFYGFIRAFIKRAYSGQSNPSGDMLLPSPVLKASDPIYIVKLPSSRGNTEAPDMSRDDSSDPMPPRYLVLQLKLRWMSTSLPALTISDENVRGEPFRRIDQVLSAESMLDLNR
jgi:hypothetical protein